MNPLYRVLALQCLVIADALCEDEVMTMMVASLLLSCLTVQIMTP